MRFNSIDLAVFSSRLNAICEEMGHVLKRSALSPNIKDRLDFSCAFFDREGRICAQAAHIPVHLGSMAYAMSDLVSDFEWYDGDVLVLNDPFKGGTHLPDVTVITPLFYESDLRGFLANRAHHANIGADAPGSMPLSNELDEEGVLIEPVKLFSEGQLNKDVASVLSAIERGDSRGEIPGDFMAQVSANNVGKQRMREWLIEVTDGPLYLADGIAALNRYGSGLAGDVLASLPRGCSECSDFMESDGFGTENIKINAQVTIDQNGIYVDFSGTDRQVKGNLNCPLSVTAASVYYVFICLLPAYVPRCHSTFEKLKIIAPKGCLVNASGPAAVAAGNVETSMRIVDVMIGALSGLGIDMPAASQGSMNNVALGAHKQEAAWDYYETIAGGMGAHSKARGLSAVQCHMTNTLNTPVESVEMHYPLRVEQYAIRPRSGGAGLYSGGDGLIRSYRFLEETSVTLLTERRVLAPWGAKGGQPGHSGCNMLNSRSLPAKSRVIAESGSVLTIKTPGGGGWGSEKKDT